MSADICPECNEQGVRAGSCEYCGWHDVEERCDSELTCLREVNAGLVIAVEALRAENAKLRANKVGATMNEISAQVVQIGEFIITRSANGALWIAKEGGEAMQLNELSEMRLGVMLEEFWEENF